MQTVVRICNLGPMRVRVRRSAIKARASPQELATIEVNETGQFDCDPIADLVIEELLPS